MCCKRPGESGEVQPLWLLLERNGFLWIRLLWFIEKVPSLSAKPSSGTTDVGRSHWRGFGCTVTPKQNCSPNNVLPDTVGFDQGFFWMETNRLNMGGTRSFWAELNRIGWSWAEVVGRFERNDGILSTSSLWKICFSFSQRNGGRLACVRSPTVWVTHILLYAVSWCVRKQQTLAVLCEQQRC